MLLGAIAYSIPAVTYDDYAPPVAYASVLTAPVALVVKEPEALSTTTIEALVRTTEAQYGLTDSFYNTLKCESAGWQNKQSQVPHAAGPNGLEDSWGVVQIHLPDHPDVTRAQALDPSFAVPWAAQVFKEGDAHLFTCYNNL